MENFKADWIHTGTGGLSKEIGYPGRKFVIMPAGYTAYSGKKRAALMGKGASGKETHLLTCNGKVHSWHNSEEDAMRKAHKAH